MNKYNGVLEYYTEQGEIQAALAIIDHPSESIWDRSFSFDKKTNLEIKIWHPQSKELVYEGKWTYSREASIKNKGFPSPAEIEANLWRTWCLNGFLVELLTVEKIKADYNSIDLDFEVDVWESKERHLISREAKIYRVVEGEKVELVKKGQKWFSQGKVKNFNYNSRTQELYIFTEEEFLLVKKSEQAVLV